MGDIRLGIEGDPSGAVSALKTTGDEMDRLHKQATAQGNAQRKQSEEFWGNVAKYAATAAAAVTAFGVASVKAFMEADRIQKQLTRAAGEYSEALSARADAMEEVFAVDGEVIKQSQTLLVQWGGVGAASEEVTKGILNYAAATGQDAVEATKDLIRNVESGGTGLAKLGVHFDATTDKGENLSRAVAALNSKFGGAGEAEASSLHGQLAAIGIAFGNLQEDIGGSIAKFAEEHGIVGKLTEAIKGMRTAAFGGPDAGRLATEEDKIRTQEHLLSNLEQRKQLMRGIEEIEARGESAPKSRAMVAHLDEGIAKLKEIIRLQNEAVGADQSTPGVGAVGGITNKGMKEAEAAAAAHATKTAADQKKNTEDWKKYLQGIDDLDEAALVKEQENFADSLALEGRHVADSIKIREDGQKAYDEIRLSEEKKTAEHAEKLAKIEEKKQDDATKDTMTRAKSKSDDAAKTADAIGAAFVNALSDQLSKLAAGEEFDVAVFVGDILASVIAVAGTVIGTAYGQPALGAAVGNLAAMGVRAGAGAISADRKKGAKKYHSGGEISDAPRYHSGGSLGSDEMHIIAQKGEHMLSRRDVANMGGHAGVEAAKRGGGTTIVNHIQAIDTKSAADSFVGGLGQGLKRALRTGQGDVPRLLGAIPR